MEHVIPHESEKEKASNSYLMSLMAIVVGLPLPIVNLVATAIFWLANRKSTYFVKWHCTQAMLSQLVLVFINSRSFWWTISILFGSEVVSNEYFAYLFMVLILNIFEFVTTMYVMIQVRKGNHVHFWFFGGLTDMFVKKEDSQEALA